MVNMNHQPDVVHTITDYCDQPREGVADFNGQPHYFRCVFDEQEDEWSNIYLLKPLDTDTFSLLIEDWNIWLRWQSAYEKGQAKMETHPALPEDRERHAEIKSVLANRLGVESDRDIKAEGRFVIKELKKEGGHISPVYAGWGVIWHTPI